MFSFDTSYLRLDGAFYAEVAPTPVAAPGLIAVNAALAARLGLDADWLASEAGLAVLAGNAVPRGAASVATAYAGHQFGNFVPQLGDGRAILLGEIVAPDGARFDVQLKGAGPTPFSRNGDGRAALGPVLREYLVSEAMAALGIPTTRALAAVTTGEFVFREEALPGGVLTRVAASHIRVGTFEYFAARSEPDAVRSLADHVIARHYPAAAGTKNPYLALLDAVVAAQARLVAQWLLVGFIHGVMNTDNCSVAGETIDYGPCAFLDEYEPGKVFSAIDRGGRYAYANQPRILQWNLSRFAETLLPLIGDEDMAVPAATAALEGFAPIFTKAYFNGLAAKIGLPAAEDADVALAKAFCALMAASHADFTNAFRALCEAAEGPAGDAIAAAEFTDPAAYVAWAAQWRLRLAASGRAPGEVAARMRAVNPAYIPRNHQIQAVIDAAIGRSDFAPFHALGAVLAEPFTVRPGLEDYALPPAPGQRVTRTFCGT